PQAVTGIEEDWSTTPGPDVILAFQRHRPAQFPRPSAVGAIPLTVQAEQGLFGTEFRRWVIELVLHLHGSPLGQIHPQRGACSECNGKKGEGGKSVGAHG